MFMPRFAILTHDHPFLHWDLLLEWGEAARTWRLLEEPHFGSVPLQPLPDHRLTYLEYEGHVGGGRGHVQRWDAGEFEIVPDAPSSSPLHVRLRGRRLSGTVLLNDTAAYFSRTEEALAPRPAE